MEKLPAKTQQTYLAIGAIIAWFAVVVQFYLLIVNRIESVPETVIRFFSFYTILTNILIALCFTVLLLKPKSGWGRFFSKPTTLTAIVVYITVVGITYNIILRFTWNPQGLQQVFDELLHVVVPVFFILYWFIFAPKAGLQWKNVFPWLIYPFVYIVCILFRGAFSGYYPYPFINVNDLGYSKALLNCCGLFIAFLLLSLLFIAIAKMMTRAR
jgi:hypothetical protein